MLLVFVLQGCFVQICTAAEAEGYPYYPRALSELRMAGGYLEEFTPSRELNQDLIAAMSGIYAAIKQINLAGTGESAYAGYHPPVDTTLNRAQRYEKALKLLEKVESDLGRMENNMPQTGLQKRLKLNIQISRAAVMRILENSSFSGKHPLYLRALFELQLSRTYLNKITPDMSLNNNELNAIGEINEAIKFISMAAIDNGRDLNNVPEQDISQNNSDRYKKALDSLNNAYGYINQTEDNAYAKSPQKQALRSINNAISIVKRAKQ